MKSFVRMVMAASTAGLVVAGACSDGALTPLGPQFATAVSPIPGDGLVHPEQVQVCKYGSSASFAYTAVDIATGTVLNDSILNLQDGECVKIARGGLDGVRVTITETGAQAGYQFSHVDVTSQTGPTTSPTIVNTTSTSPTVVDSCSGVPFRGVLIKFYNEQVLTENGIGFIGDFVWADLNGNGVQDLGEPGLAGVTVTLGGDATATTTTDATGAYHFTGLDAGTYTVTVAAPAGYTASPSLQGGDPEKDSNGSPASVTLATNSSSDTSIDFGFVPPPTGSIGDFVWNDLNGNGVQDPGEPGLAGVTVTLGGTTSATTTTDASGAYLFPGLGAGSYTVTAATPTNYSASPSGQGGDPLKDSNGSPATVTLLTQSSSDLSIDFGFVAPTGSIGDYVWEDEDGDGIQDATETGMTGITVTLTGPVSATTTTDANGAYLFSGLPAGTYTVTVATPTGFTASPSNQGGNPNQDSNGSPATVTLATNSSTDLSIDFGFVPPAGVGRMTGGGQQLDIGGARISRGLTLHCDIALSNNLEINWPGTRGTNNFHITRPLTSARCILDPAYRQPPPRAPFNTFIGVAQGTLNGIPGATARFVFIDAGEPGRNDMTQIEITDASGNVVLNVPLGNLVHGNLQAHFDQPHGSKR